MEPIHRLVSVLAPILVAVPPAVTPAAESKAASTGLLDKTQVAWICPANLTQRGGSVLTIDGSQSYFDGIVFGELTAIGTQSDTIGGHHTYILTQESVSTGMPQEKARQKGSRGVI